MTVLAALHGARCENKLYFFSYDNVFVYCNLICSLIFTGFRINCGEHWFCTLPVCANYPSKLAILVVQPSIPLRPNAHLANIKHCHYKLIIDH